MREPQWQIYITNLIAPQADCQIGGKPKPADIEDHGLAYTVTFGRFADGKVGEVFLQNHKPGSQANSNARDAAVAASLGIAIRLPTRRGLEARPPAQLPRPPSTPLGAALDAITEGEQ